MSIAKEDFCDFKGSWIITNTSNEPYYNCYARVTAINSTSITIDTANAIAGRFATFEPNYELVVHVSASVNGDTDYLGKWIWATITAVSGDLLTLDKDVTTILPADEFSKYYVQAIGVAKTDQFGRQLESAQTISPPAYSTTTFCGGIVIFKDDKKFYLGNVNIDLTDKGIPVASKNLRPWLAQENQGKLDTDLYAGWENGATSERFMLNSGDGAAFIVAKDFDFGNAATRIGNLNSKGVLNCRGAVDSANKPSGVTNVGGSTILLVSTYGRTIGNYGREKIFSKYRSTSSAEGQGLARACFISPASAGAIDDQGCVSIDALDVPNAPANNFNIKNFGSGELQDISNPTFCINNYARITDISSDRKQLTYTAKTTNGLAQIQSGALVMVVATSTSSDAEICRQEHGKMTFAKVLSVTSTKITLDTAIPAADDSTSWQIISIPQFRNFTLSTTYNLTPSYTEQKVGDKIFGYGGVCALACTGTCNLANGQLIVKQNGKAGLINYGQKVPNSNLTIRFPPTGGVGSIFILANVLTLNTSTRIGSSFTGNKLGGLDNTNVSTTGGGWKAPDKDGYSGGNGNSATNTESIDGRTFQNFASSFSQNMGANVLIIADTINNLNVAAISTGGCGYNNPNANGGCGYGGADIAGGGYHGGGGGTHGGGCAGNAFIFCNTSNNQNTLGIVVDE